MVAGPLTWGSTLGSSSVGSDADDIDTGSKEAAGSDHVAPPGAGWIRPVVAVLAILASGAAIWLVRSLASGAGSLSASENPPAAAAAIVLGVVAAMAGAVAAIRPERGTLHGLVATSAAWSLALLIALASAWAVIASTGLRDLWHGTRVTTPAEADAYLSGHVPAGVDPIRIPTGVLVQSMEFLSGDNVQLTGYVWQRFGPDVPDDVARGVVLPEAIREAYDAKEAYRYVEGDVETVGWYFYATLRQPFSYGRYPFDEQDVWLRLWSRDFARDVVLVPDFASYRNLAPGALPGIESEFVFGGWKPVDSGFTYSVQPYDTSFGIGAADDAPPLPELYFNLILDREFGGPFFEHLVFSIAVAVLLFGLLVLTTDDENLKSRFQLSTAGVLGAASGLLFAVILKHNQLRTVVGNQGVSYIEVIPIILYGAIVAVVLNAILVAAPWKPRVVAHRNNLVPVLAYWPVMLGLLLMVTLLTFFRG